MWAAIAGHQSVIVLVIVGEDVERVVVASVALVHKRHVSDDIRCCDIVRGGVFTTLGLGATTLGAGAPVLTVGCEPVRTVGHSGICHPAKMAVKS